MELGFCIFKFGSSGCVNSRSWKLPEAWCDESNGRRPFVRLGLATNRWSETMAIVCARSEIGCSCIILTQIFRDAPDIPNYLIFTNSKRHDGQVTTTIKASSTVVRVLIPCYFAEAGRYNCITTPSSTGIRSERAWSFQTMPQDWNLVLYPTLSSAGTLSSPSSVGPSA